MMTKAKGMSQHAVKHVTELMADGKERSVRQILTELFEKPLYIDPLRKKQPTRTRSHVIPTDGELRMFFKRNNYAKRKVKMSERMADGTIYRFQETYYRVRDKN